MKRMFVPLALLLSGLASALTSTQRQQHIDQVLSASGFVSVACQNITPRPDQTCAQTSLSDSLIRESWDLYSSWNKKVTVTAVHAAPWKLSASGASYSGTFTTTDDDTYVVTATTGSSDNFIIVSWIGASSAAPAASGSVPVSAASTAAGTSASTDRPDPVSECAPRAIRVASVTGSGWIRAEWKEPASFPNPSRAMKAGGPDTDYLRTCPTFEAKFDHLSGVYTFRGSTFQDLIEYSGVSRYNAVSSIDLVDRTMDAQLVTLGITYDRSGRRFRFIGQNVSALDGTTLGYRVDSGTLQPLFFEGKLSELTMPETARTLEIYAMPGASTSWQYLKLDLQTNTLTLKRTSAFPQK